MLGIDRSNCDGCGAPNRTVVLRQYGWWTLPTLEATVWALNGRFTDVLPGMRRESSGAVITAVHGRQFIDLPWRVAGKDGPVFITACFPNVGAHRWVTICLSLFAERLLCQWCRFHNDPRFSRVKRNQEGLNDAGAEGQNVLVDGGNRVLPPHILGSSAGAGAVPATEGNPSVPGERMSG